MADSHGPNIFPRPNLLIGFFHRTGRHAKKYNSFLIQLALPVPWQVGKTQHGTRCELDLFEPWATGAHSIVKLCSPA